MGTILSKFLLYLYRNIHSDPPSELSHRDSSDKGSQCMFLIRNKKKKKIIIIYSLSLQLWIRSALIAVHPARFWASGDNKHNLLRYKSEPSCFPYALFTKGRNFRDFLFVFLFIIGSTLEGKNLLLDT